MIRPDSNTPASASNERRTEINRLAGVINNLELSAIPDHLDEVRRFLDLLETVEADWKLAREASR